MERQIQGLHPGIGSFTILDDKIVDATDVGNNFFLTSDSIGQPRAQVSVELLKELNDGVQGKALLSVRLLFGAVVSIAEQLICF